MTDTELPFERRLGATPTQDGAVVFRVWAPRAQTVAVRVQGADHDLRAVGHGVYEASVRTRGGADYWFVLDGRPLPDPWSHWQPEGVRGPSRVLDPSTFHWRSEQRPRRGLAELVIYELHVGTFTEEGTFAALKPHLRRLRELGVTAIELMPVAEFDGDRGWGYDGVYISAAYSRYGGPFALQQLIDAAHEADLAVILDVVYNHVGAAGVKAMEAYGPFFTDRHDTFWGKAISYDDEDCDAVREWVLQSAEGWVRDFRIDGLRLDAIHAIHDESARPILRELATRVHAVDARTLVIAESDLNDPRVITPNGHGLDAQWADDFHHSLHALLTGERDGYYADYGAVADLATAFRRPFVYDGRYSVVRRRRFGAPANECPAERFVVYCAEPRSGRQPRGRRTTARTKRDRLAAFCVLLSPFTPLLFMGEEYGEQAPFQYFTDHVDPELGDAPSVGSASSPASPPTRPRSCPTRRTPRHSRARS